MTWTFNGIHKGDKMARLAFLFPGQGSQKVGMGRDFYEAYSQAQEIFEQADETLGFKISHLCFEGPGDTLQLTQNAQPALLTVSHIAYKLLERNPLIAAGHSLGEYSALVSAGSLKFKDAVLLVHKRGKYMQEAVPVGVGAMAAVLGVEYETVKEEIKTVKSGVVEIANWNSRDQIVISGQDQAVREALSRLNPPRSVILPVSAPFHCSLMRAAEDKLSYDLDYVEFNDLAFPIITNVDAKIVQRGEEARDALKRQVSRTVLWYSSIQILENEKIEGAVELGVGKVLSGLMKRITRSWPSPPTVMNVEDSESLASVSQSF